MGALEKSFYNVISPEGGVSILQNSVYGKDAQQMRRDFGQNCELLARAQRCFAADILELGIVDELIPMGSGEADRAQNIARFVLRHLESLCALGPEELARQRQKRFERICDFATVDNIEAELAKADRIAKSSPRGPKKTLPSAPVDGDVRKALEFVAAQTMKSRTRGTLENVAFHDVQPHFIPTSQILPTPKQILRRSGRNALRQYLLDSPGFLLTDTSFRDAHQSVVATRFRTSELVQAARYLQMTGLPTSGRLFSCECWGGATFDVCLRFLHEDPWTRLRALSDAIPDTLTQMLLRGSNLVGYTRYGRNLVE